MGKQIVTNPFGMSTSTLLLVVGAVGLYLLISGDEKKPQAVGMAKITDTDYDLGPNADGYIKVQWKINYKGPPTSLEAGLQFRPFKWGLEFFGLFNDPILEITTSMEVASAENGLDGIQLEKWMDLRTLPGDWYTVYSFVRDGNGVQMHGYAPSSAIRV